MNVNMDMAGASPAAAAPPLAVRWLTALNATLARLCMWAAVGGLLVIVGVVFYQVFGRYVLNSSPTWTEGVAMVLILYVTLMGAAVGVRDAGHIGLDSLLVLLPDQTRRAIELVIYLLVIVFGAAMVYNGWLLASTVASYRIPNLGWPESVRYLPLVISGGLSVLFSIEHIAAILCGTEVEPSWN